MAAIYEKSNDVHVASHVIYAGANGKYFHDADLTKEVEAEGIFKMFVKGLLVFKDGKYIVPTACTEAGELTLPTLA
jgi:hypothetical protein